MTTGDDAAGAVAGAEVVYCSRCGTPNPAGNKFCGKCGTTLVVAPPQAVVLADAAPAVATPPAPSPVPTLAPRPVADPVPPPSAPPFIPPVNVPADPITRERERDRLLTLANVQRMRGQTSEARVTLGQALVMVEGMKPAQIAPIHELLGDLLLAEERWEEALAEFGRAHYLDNTRAGAERKFASLTLRLAETKANRTVADAMLRGESVVDLMAGGAMESGRGRRNAGVAMLLSAFVPGFGQFYNGEFIKGAILLGGWLVCVLIFAVSSQRDQFFKKLVGLIALNSRTANIEVSPLLVCVGIAYTAFFLYSLVDAPFMAAKTPKNATGPVIDKTGWEV